MQQWISTFSCFNIFQFSIVYLKFAEMMHGQALARFIFGIMGNVFLALLTIAPVPTYRRIIKRKSTEEFHPYPYLAMVMSCLLWIFYGLPMIHPGMALVTSISAFALVMEMIYLTIFFIYTKKYRMHIIIVLLVEAAFMAIVVVITILCFHNGSTRTIFVGVLCIIFGIIMYASPLSIIYQVWRTKSVEYLPFWRCFVGFCNGICWVTFGCLEQFDPYLVTGCGVGGVLFGFIQLSVYSYYTIKVRENAEIDIPSVADAGIKLKEST